MMMPITIALVKALELKYNEKTKISYVNNSEGKIFY